MTEAPSSKSANAHPPARWSKLILFAVIVLTVALAYVFFGDRFSLRSLAAKEAQLRQLLEREPVTVYAVVFVIYVAVTALSLPLASPMTLVIGWYFGFWRGVVLVSFASTLGAILAFLLSRYLLHDAIQRRFADRLVAFNQAIEREGAFYLFAIRLTPAIPFFVVNVVAGLTKLRVWTFWWISQLGMLPGTCAYVYAGSTVPDLNTLADRGAGSIVTPQLIIAFVVLGVFPLVVRRIVRWARSGADGASTLTERTDP